MELKRLLFIITRRLTTPECICIWLDTYTLLQTLTDWKKHFMLVEYVEYEQTKTPCYYFYFITLTPHYKVIFLRHYHKLYRYIVHVWLHFYFFTLVFIVSVYFWCLFLFHYFVTKATSRKVTAVDNMNFCFCNFFLFQDLYFVARKICFEENFKFKTEDLNWIRKNEILNILKF